MALDWIRRTAISASPTPRAAPDVASAAAPEPTEPVVALRHVAIIMDGNGRWAAARNLPRSEGHRKGVAAVRSTIRAANELGLKQLTLFSFSSENWSRPADEVNMLFGLFRTYVRRDIDALNESGVRIRVIGRRDGLPDDIRDLIGVAEDRTHNNSRLQVNFAFNYGGRDEIVRSVRALAEDVAAGRLSPEAVDEAAVARHLDTAGVPDPDLIIRTSGEMRLSNFLLWQCAYSEFLFLPIFWPDFGRAELEEAIGVFTSRSRRYGGLAVRGKT